jgi:hypothetical protein
MFSPRIICDIALIDILLVVVLTSKGVALGGLFLVKLSCCVET